MTKQSPAVSTILAELTQLTNPDKTQVLSQFFKTKPGEYAEGDQFLGITVPQIRTLARKHHQLALSNLQQLINHPYHEARMLALIILVNQSKQSPQPQFHQFYLNNLKHVNNWDLVDLSAEHLVGAYLKPTDLSLLIKLAQSPDLWERRISIIATFHFIKQGHPKPTLDIATLLLNDHHDLIHKAVGWMLREVGKRCSIEIEEQFLTKHYQQIPRTMLRYAIERFPEPRRQQYLQGTI